MNTHATDTPIDQEQPASGAGGAGAEARPKVLYVLGAGRSGSTILGVALGNCDGVFFAGELNKWLAQSGAPSLKDAPRVEFWSTVREQVTAAAGLFGHQTSCLERSSALFKVGNWRKRRRLRRPYRAIAEELYRALSRATGASYLVDTSHYPLRARELQALKGIDLYLVYLVRDPHDVVSSLARKDVPERSFGRLTTNAYLWLTNLLSAFVFLRHPRERRLFVRHEDFRADPEGVLRQILQTMGASPTIPDLTSLRTGLPLHGNRLVQNEVVALEGGRELPRRKSATTTLLQLPWTVLLPRLRPAATASRSQRRA